MPSELFRRGRSPYRASPPVSGQSLNVSDLFLDGMYRQAFAEAFREGRYLAEVQVELTEDDSEWSPCLGVEDAGRLDGVREALRQGDITGA